ncbi:MAG: hypothetical protein ACFCUU_11605 [Cyclobacteriaceae bacterium]
MKALGNLAYLSFLCIALLSCEQSETNPDNIGDQELQSSEGEIAIAAIFEDVDDVAYYSALEDEGSRVSEDDDNPIRCAARIVNVSEKTIVVDFGEGCIDKWGKHRMGKIILRFSDRKFVPGAVHTITFEDYYVDSVKVEGLRTKKNISRDKNEFKFEVTLEDGKLTWPDGTFVTRDSKLIKTRNTQVRPVDSELHIDGYAYGINKMGLVYRMNITKTLVFKRMCSKMRPIIPVEGTKVIKVEGKEDLIIDYGNGECNNEVRLKRGRLTKVVHINRLRG